MNRCYIFIYIIIYFERRRVPEILLWRYCPKMRWKEVERYTDHRLIVASYSSVRESSGLFPIPRGEFPLPQRELIPAPVDNGSGSIAKIVIRGFYPRPWALQPVAGVSAAAPLDSLMVSASDQA
jgi:hypothetical protein